jgi:hypothetical protein
MQRVNEYSFYELANAVHPLTELAENLLLSSVWPEWWNTRIQLTTLFSLRSLTVCVGSAARLRAAITAIVPESWEDLHPALTFPPGVPEEPIAFWKVNEVQMAAKEFETVLAAECQVMDTYFVPKKGTYSTADLIERAHYQVPPIYRSGLPEFTKADLDQAGRCLAFDLPTAAAFHLLRGTEAALRQYYERVVPGTKRAAPKMRNWGVYLKLLKEHGAEPRVTSLLDHLKDSYRNPVLHPEENYTDERAQVLFGVCVSALVLMIEEIKRLDKTSLFLPLEPIPLPIPNVTIGTG